MQRSLPRPIEVEGRRYNDVNLLRTNITRKPMYPISPLTLEGWEELESVFSPSTVRDEITYRRMIFEYYRTPAGAKQHKKKEEIIAWLMTLPYAQREIMAADFEIALPAAKDRQKSGGEMAVPIF